MEIYDRDPNLVARLETNLGPVVLKWYGWRHPVHFWLSPLRSSRAWRSWKTARALIRAGARTPTPLYIYEQRKKGFISENYFITSCIHPHRKLRDFLKSDTPIDLMEQVIADLARSIAHMHTGNIQHRDLTSGNFLVDTEGQVYLVDLNRARRRGHLSIRQRLADLARINFTASDPELIHRLARRFAQVYGETTQIVIDWEKQYWKVRQRRIRKRQLKRRLKRLLNRQ